MAQEFKDASFEEDVLKSDTPVLVDFWAPWCGPCRMLAPTIDAISEEYDTVRKGMKKSEAFVPKKVETTD